MATSDHTLRRLVKIDENIVELQYYLFDADENIVVVEELTESYGVSRIADYDDEASAELAYWQNFDVAARAEKIAAAQKKVDRANFLKQIIDAANGTIINLNS